MIKKLFKKYIWMELQGRKNWRAKMKEPLRARIISTPDEVTDNNSKKKSNKEDKGE